MTNFKKDLSEAKIGERIALETLRANNPSNNWIYSDVSDDADCYYKGDISATNKKDGTVRYIEIKTDGTIARTHNILCEDRVFYADKNKYADGNMHCASDFYLIVSKSERKIYCFDFKKLQQIYKTGKYKVIPHHDSNGNLMQTTFCYLLGLHNAKEQGALLKIMTY